MKNCALITGASSGIGLELARIHASKGSLVLVARSENDLIQLKTELEAKHSCEVKIICKDLTLPGAPKEIYDELASEGIQISVLMNNAGLGGYGYFHERALKDEQFMIQLNIQALVELTHLFLPGMLERKSGKILTTASTAGFMPGPLQTVYFATKAFVVSFSQALAFELKNSGVTVTALCPGPVKTGFAKAANMDGNPLFKNAISPEVTARKGYTAMEKGKLKTITDWKLRLAIFGFMPFLPIRWVMKVIFSMQKGS